MRNYYKQIITAIYEIGVLLNGAVNKSSALTNTLAMMHDALEIKRGLVLLKDKSGKSLYIEASFGFPNVQIKNITYKSNEGIVGKVFSSGIPLMIPNIANEPMFLHKLGRENPQEDMGFMAVPIKYDNEVMGVLAVDKASPLLENVGTDIDLLKMISSMIASFLKKWEKHEIEKRKLEEEKNLILEEKEILAKDARKKYNFTGLIGRSKVMEQVCNKIANIVDTSSTVLIRGESGTGKEVVAKTIHYNSYRAKKPFIAVNCAAIPEELIESELFGHSRGAFTGAVSDKKGKFELADGGTIFLDEIGDMPLNAQSKLLRVLQDKTIEKVGGQKSIKLDVRVIAATNRNLEELIKEGQFRLDLYYRLNVISIYLPPLRKRKEDLPEIAAFILDKLRKNYKKDFQLDQSAFSVLQQCKWPGNIRELENCLERAALNSRDNIIKAEDIACMRGENCMANFFDHILLDEKNPPEEIDFAERDMGRGKGEKEKILEALERCGWVQAKAARYLGLTIRQMNYRIKKYNIPVKKL